MEMLYHSVNDLIRLANEYQIPLWKVVLLADVQERQVTVEESFETMRQMYQAMRQADQEYDGSIVSASGMAGGDGEKLHAYNASGRSLAGGYMGLVMEKAVKMGESNACMKRIVAAPTAGACGVIPAVFLSYEEYCKETENRMVEALFVSAGIGAVIAENASIAGASGGCPGGHTPGQFLCKGDLMAFWETVLGKYIMTMAIAAVPVVELRGAIPAGIAAGLDPWLACGAAIFGNLLPVPFIILLVRQVFDRLRKHAFFAPKIDALERRAHLKGRLVRKYRLLGLMLFVAIPLPGTGAWTGALIAAFLNIRLRHALPAITLGLLIAGSLVTLMTLGLIHLL